MNSIGRLFADFDEEYLLLKRSLQIIAENQVVLYVFRVIDSVTMSSTLKEILNWSGRKCTQFRGTLATSGKVNKNLKFYLYSRLTGEEVSSKLFGVDMFDRKLAGRLLTSSAHEAMILRKALFRYRKRGCRPINLSTFETAVGRAVVDLDVYCRKFAYKKLKFIMQTSALSPSDIVQELLAFGIYSVYRAYPEIEGGRLHLQNIAKTGIHNRGINMIKAATTQGRNPMLRYKDGTFANVAISLSSRDATQGDWVQAPSTEGGGYLTVCNNLIVTIEGKTADGMRPEDTSNAFELSHSVTKLATKIKEGKYRTFYHLMQGHYHQGFSEHLGKDNDDFYEASSRMEYINQCIVYLEIDRENAKRFIGGLKKRLAGWAPSVPEKYQGRHH